MIHLCGLSCTQLSELMHTAHVNKSSVRSSLFLSFKRNTIGGDLRMNIVAWLLLLGSMGPALGVARYPVKPGDWKKYYTAVPQASNTTRYSKTSIYCKGAFALCAYATCVPVPESEPPVAQCGCFSYPESTLNIGAIVGTLDRQLKDEMKETCKKKTGKPFCALKESNQAPFCKAMNNKSMYKGARPDFISTYNPDKWNASVGSVPKAVDCPNGGTYTNCNSAACYDGYAAPLSLQKMPHANLFNATCYCPYYVTTDSVTVWNAPVDNPCGPSNPKEVTAGSVIFNGL